MLLFAATAAAERLVLKDGSRVEGKITLCDEEACIAGKRRVALDTIARITLREVRLPPGVHAGSVVMADGSLRSGRFSGLNLGVVYVDDAEIDRADVAEILLAEPAVARAGDVFIGSDGAKRNGTLSRCDAASCTFDGALVPRTAIRWLGPGQERAAPPGAPPSSDLVFIRDGNPIEARLTSIDDSTVGTTHGNFPRSQVTWIHVAETSAGASAKGAVPGAEATTPQQQPAQPPVKPPVQPPVQPPVRPPGAPPPSQPPGGAPQRNRSELVRGGLWSGTIAARQWGSDDGEFSELTINVEVRLREFSVPMRVRVAGQMKTGGTVTLLEPEGSVIRNHFKCSGPYLSCDGEGSTTTTSVPGEANRLHPSIIYAKKTSDSMLATFGFDLAQGQALYVVGVTTGDEKYDVVYKPREGASSTSSYHYIVPLIGRLPVGPNATNGDPQHRYLDGGKMIGSYVTPTDAGAFQNLAMSWAICREGVGCPPPPALPDDNGPLPPRQTTPDDPCGELKKLAGEMRTLLDIYKTHERDYKKALADRDTARDAIWGPGGALQKFFTSMLSLAGKGASALLGKAIALSTTLMNMSGQGNASDVNSALKALGYGPQDVLTNVAAQQAVKAAVERADDYLAQTGDDAGALRLYAASIERSEELASAGKTLTKGIGVVAGAASYAQKTSALADLIQNYLDADGDATRAKNDMDAVNDRQQDVQAKIDALRAQLTGPCPTASLRIPLRLPPVDGAPFVLVAQRSSSSGAAVSVQQRLRTTGERLGAIPSSFESATPWLLPFLYNQTSAASPRLLSALLKQAVPQLQSVRTTIDDALALQQTLDHDLGQVVPQSQAPAKNF